MRHETVRHSRSQDAFVVDAAEAGEEVLITRHGKPVAKLGPAVKAREQAGGDAAARIRALRDEIERKYGADPDFDWKAAVDEGRS